MRLALFIIGLVGILVSPWITLVASVILVVRYPAVEVLLLGLCVDFLWSPATLSLQHLPLATIAAIIMLWAFDPLRRDFLIT